MLYKAKVEKYINDTAKTTGTEAAMQPETRSQNIELWRENVTGRGVTWHGRAGNCRLQGHGTGAILSGPRVGGKLEGWREVGGKLEQIRVIYLYAICLLFCTDQDTT